MCRRQNQPVDSGATCRALFRRILVFRLRVAWNAQVVILDLSIGHTSVQAIVQIKGLDRQMRFTLTLPVIQRRISDLSEQFFA